VQQVQDECGLPVVSASIATTYQMLKKLDLDTYIPRGGALLSGKY
jgi:maleate isomerase